MFRQFAGAGLLAVLVVLSGCGKTSTGSSDASRDDYTRLAASYNHLRSQQRTLLDTSHKLQSAAQKEQQLLLEMDLKLVTFVRALEGFYAQIPKDRPLTEAEDEALGKSVEKLSGTYREALTSVAAVEVVLIEEQSAMYANAALVYENAKANQDFVRTQEKLFRDRGQKLLGVREVLAMNWTQLSTYTGTLRVASGGAPRVETSTPAPAPKRIELNTRDQEVARSVGARSSGFARDSRGALTALGDRDAIVGHATANGFDALAAGDGATMASRTGGLVAFANTAKDLPKVVIDVVAHIKPQLNQNSDDLELALVIDYSGSMSDKIQATLEGLKDVVDSLKNVVASGRNVRVALVTFGEAGKEKVELDFTRNMTVVQQELDRLYKEYGSKQHSTDPGEASIHGLEKSAKSLSWASKNRMAIAITDEPSQEIQLGDTKYVDSVFELLKARGVQSRIYTIVVK